MLNRTAAIFAASCWLLVGTVAFAQTQSPAPPAPSPSPPQQCTPAEGGKDSGQLGNRLSESKGVICPPENQGSEIKVPPPDSGAKMPVIKPPADAK